MKGDVFLKAAAPYASSAPAAILLSFMAGCLSLEGNCKPALSGRDDSCTAIHFPEFRRLPDF